ncbi:hypothetical protein [Pseudolactococcus hodotermopsidis]|nr:hypothetical protein [Lactococcus hodotermopsidis]
MTKIKLEAIDTSVVAEKFSKLLEEKKTLPTFYQVELCTEYF